MSGAFTCPKCGQQSGDDWRQCGGSCPMPGSPHYAPGVARVSGHRARLGDWGPVELKAHLASIVDALNREPGRKGPAGPLDVALELLGGELEAFVLFGRMGHLDPPRPDGEAQVAILQLHSEDPEIDARIREVAKKWALDQERRS